MYYVHVEEDVTLYVLRTRGGRCNSVCITYTWRKSVIYIKTDFLIKKSSL